MNKLVLLGDSVFDNKVYVGDGPAVVDEARFAFGEEWQVTLLAQDGAKIKDVYDQLGGLPDGPDVLVLSVGGNDLLGKLEILASPVDSVAEALVRLAAVLSKFGEEHRSLLDRVVQRGAAVVVCTIYNPRFEDAGYRVAASTALALFNDAIVRNASRFGTPVLELRHVVSQPEDYANAIEPSSVGARKIAEALRQVVLGFTK